MEGWYANEDGTFSISFGYLNANSDTMIVPLGPVLSKLKAGESPLEGCSSSDVQIVCVTWE